MKSPVKQWQMPSSTNPAKKYTIDMYADSSMSCNCPRWINARNGVRNCPHIIALESVLRLESIDRNIATTKSAPVVKRVITKVED